MCLTFPLAFISRPHFAANINFLLEQTGLFDAHCCCCFFYKRTKWERIGRCCTIIPNLFMIIYAWNLIWWRDKCTLFPLLLSLSPSRIGDHKCLGQNAKHPMKEQWPFLIGSCPDKRQVNLACEGAGPSLLSTSQTLTASHWRGGRRGEKKKKSLNWWGLNMNGFKLSTW